jgi:S1-C subfamily serine protease
VLGVITSALMSGLSLVIPGSTVQRTVEALLASGRVRRGYLGIMAQAVELPQPLRARLGQEAGLLLIRVDPGSPAESSRLMQGDTLVRLDGQPLRSLGDLMQVLNSGRAERRVPAQVVRGGQVREVEVLVGER